MNFYLSTGKITGLKFTQVQVAIEKLYLENKVMAFSAHNTNQLWRTE